MAYQPRGQYFEDIDVGYEMTSSGRTITETDIVNFAALSGDWTQIHTDAEYARTSMVGERIAHGLLGLSITSGLLMALGFGEGTILLFMGLEWKFKNVIKIGDTIHAVARVKQKREMKAFGGGMVVLDIRLLNQRDEVTQQGDWSILIKSRSAEAAPAATAA